MNKTSFDTIRVRFAPSPTGYLHIGGARTALFNYLFAKNQNGKFLLRIEDTDKKRSTKEAIDAIFQGLDWLGLKNDEQTVFQSQNLLRHQEIAFELLQKGKAYKCYESSEKLTEMRENAKKEGKVFRFQSPWRDENYDGEKSSENFVIRLKAPQSGAIKIHDLVQGEISIKSEEVDDLVLLRADKTPTYMLSVVVDDFDMKITHIIRGDDHLTNAFRQKAIYDALDWQTPQFAHIPLIYGADGAKMSKRHGATNVIDYKEMGYLPETMRNYLLRLGFSDGDKEIISDQEAIAIFDLKKVGKSPSRFDFAKLGNLNKHYIKEKSEAELFQIMEQFLTQLKSVKPLKSSDSQNQSVQVLVQVDVQVNNQNLSQKISENEKQKIIKALKFSKEKPDNLKEIAKSCEIYFDNALEKFENNFNEKQQELIKSKYDLLMQIQGILNEIQDWNFDEIKNSLTKFADENNLKIKDFGPVLRLVLTFFESSSGGIFEIIEVLEKEEVVKRIANIKKYTK